MKYYFVSYLYYDIVRRGDWVPCCNVISQFPLEFIQKQNNEHDDMRYVLLSWQKINEEQYNKYKNKL